MRQFYWPSAGKVLFLLSCFAVNSSLVSANDVKTLYVGGLFPITGSSSTWDGKSLLDISEEAINMVNNRSDVLAGYQLQLFWNDTKCDPGHATDVLYESLYFRHPMITLLGAACSSVTRATAQSGRNWNLLQVSYASMASDLSNKDKFPLLYGTVPSYSAQNAARMAFLKYFGWKRIATIRQNEYNFNEVMHMFQENLLNDGFDLRAAEVFSDDPKPSITKLKQNDARIIVGMFDEDAARKVLCEAFKQDMYGEHYVWLLLDWYDNKRWWQVKDNELRCTAEQMTKAVEGYFSIESARIVSNKEPTVAKITSEEFLQSYGAANKRTDLYLPFAFDSVWLIALTLNNSMNEIYTKLNRSLEDFNYKDSDMVQILKNTMEKLEFRGVTGSVKFTKAEERTRPTCIKQMQGGSPKVVGMYYPETNKTVFSSTDVMWQGKLPPPDGKVIIYEMQYVSSPLFCVIVIFASAGILLGLYFLWFNIAKRNHSYIKSSSPNVNNLVVLGCMFIYISVYMIATDGMRADEDELLGLCIVRGYLLSIGYSLAVGAMFSKTWRVYQIFSNVKPKRKIFTNWELTGVILILVLLDILVMSMWVGVDTPEIVTINVESQATEEANQRIIPQHQYCTSKYLTTWLHILLGYKLLLLLVGCFIAWVTRKVKVHSLNDSRFVSMSVYTIVLCVIVGIPLSFLINDHVNALVACISFILLLASTVTLCLLFIPKIIKLKNNVEEDLHRLQSLSSTGITSPNTRGTSSSSFESQRAEDPNVVMRLQEEIAALKQEIRTIKDKHEKETSNLSVRITDPIENSRAARTFSQSETSPSPRPTPRPQLGKRSVTCNTSKELGVRIRRRKRSSSFSGPYWHGQSLDLGSLYSDLADPVLVLKAENKELYRKLQKVRISETGKLAKVLYENAQLNRQIVELNIKNAPSDEAEKVSRLVKENVELKKQLGEVSILNSVWCDTTPSLKRKQREDRKISKELRELQHLLSVDLGGHRHGSFKPSLVCRPPPIGRSQSSTDLQIYRNSCTLHDKKGTIGPLAKDDAERFSFDGVSKKPKLCAKVSRKAIQITVTDAEKSLSRPKSPQDCASPNTVRRDIIDGCESERESSDFGGTTNAGFSDEDDSVQDAVINGKGFNLSSKHVPKECRMADSKNRIPVTSIEMPIKGSMDHGMNEGRNSWTTISVPEPAKGTNDSKEPKDTSEETGDTATHHMTAPSVTQHDTALGSQRGPLFSSYPEETVSALNSDFVLQKKQDIPSSLIINFNAAIDQNGNLQRSGQGENVFENVKETTAISSQERGKEKTYDRTLDSSRSNADVDERGDHSPCSGSPKDVPAYKGKLNRRRDKSKPDKIEKTYFV